MSTAPPAAGELCVLVVAPTGRDASLLTDLLTTAGIETLTCSSVEEALCVAERTVGTLVLADEALGPAQRRRVRSFRDAQPTWSDVPVIVLTRKPGTFEPSPDVLTGMGQISVIERPVGRGPMLTAVQAALRARARQYEARAQMAALEAVSSELRIANSFKDELLGLVSHELRTPLTGIMGCAQILSRRFNQLNTADRESLLRDISDHGLRLQRIIENMLVLSRAETSSETNIEPLLLQRTLPGVIDELTPLTGGRRLSLHLDESLPPVNANAVFVQQVVSNLVRNSEKYAARDTDVEVRIAHRGDAVAITVADRGEEFSQPDVDRMFDAFYRDPQHTLKIAGLGLGLPVCKRLTEIQGGSISAQPRPGGGLEVTVAFPLATE